MFWMVKRFLGLLVVVGWFAALVGGCYDDHPASDKAFQCNPDDNDCGADAKCVKAGAFHVCSRTLECPGGCSSNYACIDGECKCFASCEDKLCGSDGCGGICGVCPSGDSWWCDGGTCLDDCRARDCGLSPNLGISCGDCPVGDEWSCVSGVCKNDCDGLECGDSPNLRVTCGACGSRERCNVGKCVDDCGLMECGTSEFGTECGSCDAKWWCDLGTCRFDCGIKECGISEHGLNCGSCPQGWWCDSGACRDDCEGRVCGSSPNLGISCGECAWRWWCDDGVCKDDCEGLQCGNSPHLNLGCAICPDGFWCESGTCRDDCAGLECGPSPHVEWSCGTCEDRYWCDGGACVDDCGSAECGVSEHGFSCGDCPDGSNWWCDLGACHDDCLALECGESPILKVDCGTCDSRKWCNAGVCEDDCGDWECGTAPHGGDCGECQDGWWCNSGVCEDDCAGLECGPSPHLDITCGTCASGFGCKLGDCIETGEMVLIPEGAFWMGCNVGVDQNCNSWSAPLHEVDISAFYMDKVEVTQAAFQACVDAGICTHHQDDGLCSTYDPVNLVWVQGVMPQSFRGDSRPAVCVSWAQAKVYCDWAGKRMPTEAEWEKAARGIGGQKYPWGSDEVTCEYAVIYDSFLGGVGCGTNGSEDVCSRSPTGDSPYGLCDAAGNVWEWVSDWYLADYYESSSSSDPTGPSIGTTKVCRGGGAIFGPETTLTWIRQHYVPSHSDVNLGFRCAMSP